MKRIPFEEKQENLKEKKGKVKKSVKKMVNRSPLIYKENKGLTKIYHLIPKKQLGIRSYL